jgi:hypothetical protein
MSDPEIRPSRPTTTAGRPEVRLMQYSPNAEAYRTTASGVRELPTIPRIPEMLTINDMENTS